MTAWTLDPEVAAFVRRSEEFYADAAPVPTIAETRAAYDRLCRAFHAPPPPGLRWSDLLVRASEPARDIACRRYMPPTALPGCAVLYLHGGGYVLGGIASHDSICADLAAGAGVSLLAVDYRLAPEHLYPSALDDAEAAYDWLRAQAARVVVAGDSAGGGLAAALCLRLRRLGKPAPAGQLLIYPGLHPRAGRATGTWRQDVPMLRATDSLAYRRAYTGGSAADVTDDPELAPLAAGDFSGLPPAAIFAADIDPLADDAADYAAALRGAGIHASFAAGEGLVHGYLRGRHASTRIADEFAAIVASLHTLTLAAAPTPVVRL